MVLFEPTDHDLDQDDMADKAESPIKTWRVKHGLSRGEACLVLGLSDDGYGKQLAGIRAISAQTHRLMEDWDTFELEQRERLLAELRIKAKSQ